MGERLNGIQEVDGSIPFSSTIFPAAETPAVTSLKAPTLPQLRRYAIARSLFKPTSLPRAIARLGFVQADPMRAPARAQDLILAHRVKDYRAGELERRYPGVKARLCDAGGLRPGMVVAVDTAVAGLGLLQPVGPDSEVHFLPAIGGG